MPPPAARGAVPRRRLPWVLVIGVASSAAMLTRAQTHTRNVSDFSGWLPAGAAYVAPSLVFTWTATDNVFRVPDGGSAANGARPVSSTLLEVTPQVRIAVPYSRSQFELDFRPSWRDYSRVELTEHMSGDLALRNALVLSNGMEFDLEATRSRGTFERNDFDQAGQINFSTTPYRTTGGSAAWTWTHPSHWATVLSVEAQDYSFDNDLSGASPAEPAELLFDNRSSNLFLDVEWIVQPKLGILAGIGTSRERVTAIGEDSDCDGDGTLDPPDGRLDPCEEGRTTGGRLVQREDRFRQDDIRLGLRGQIGPRLFADGTLARSTLRSEDTGEEQFGGITTRLDTRFQLTRSSDLSFQYDRQPQQTLTSRREVFVYRSLRAGWTMTGLRNSFSAGVRSITSRLPDRREEFLLVDASWSLRIRRWTSLRIGLTRAVKTSTTSAFEYGENRASIGWAVGWF